MIIVKGDSMNTNLVKRIHFVIGLILFIGGCIFLIFLTIAMQRTAVSIEGIFGSIAIFVFVVLIFYTSINSFIRYGIARGIDYAIERQKPMTMKDIDNRIDEIVKTCDKKQK